LTGFDEVEIDAGGNVVGRYKPAAGDGKYLLTGSHYDTVRNGGKYDGRTGIFVPLACVRELHRAGRRLPFGIELVAFAEEEGQRYKATFLGSGALVGDFDPGWLDQQDADGITLRAAMEHAGLRIADIPKLKRDPARYLGYIEVHIEQGPVLNEMGLPLGVVTSINASSRYLCAITGMASHAGTTPMNRRRDAAAAAAELLLYMEERAARDGDSVATMGMLSVPSGSVTWCRGAANSAWTCAPPATPSAMPSWPTSCSAWTTSASAAACSTWPSAACKPAPRPATPRCSSAGKPPYGRWACPCTACPAAPGTTR